MTAWTGQRWAVQGLSHWGDAWTTLLRQRTSASKTGKPGHTELSQFVSVITKMSRYYDHDSTFSLVCSLLSDLGEIIMEPTGEMLAV